MQRPVSSSSSSDIDLRPAPDIPDCDIGQSAKQAPPVVDSAEIPNNSDGSFSRDFVDMEPAPPQVMASNASKSAQIDGTAGFDVEKLVRLMEEQVSLLRRIDERQAANDLSQQPMPEVPATSNSTWGALLRTTVAEIIQPKVERWRSGLDALLVFLGLFSAIVTAFLVESLSGLRQDEAARTNELLVNLTEIMISLSGANPHNLNMLTPVQFEPDSSNIRLNSYWSLSLVLSLCVAALAVTCRGFLNMATLSRHAKATDKLIDIRARWTEAEKNLGPVIETVPQLLVIPVLLFVVGLLDNILSNILRLPLLPILVMVTTSLSFLFVASVIAFLGYSLFDGSTQPHTSPFQSILAGYISSRIIPTIQTWVSSLKVQIRELVFHAHSNSVLPEAGATWTQDPQVNNPLVMHYHQIVQAIHDDETLDKASTALRSVLGLSNGGAYSTALLHEEEATTLVHLLSPEASIRANRTAAAALVGFYRFTHKLDPSSEAVTLALTQAARRSVVGTSLATLWTSPFLGAMVALQCTQTTDPGPQHPALIRILGSQYLSVQHQTHSKVEVIRLLIDILWAAYPCAFNNRETPPKARRVSPEVIQLFEPGTVYPTAVLQALYNLPQEGDYNYVTKIYSIVWILMEAKSAQLVIQAAFKVLKFLENDSAHSLMTVSIICQMSLESTDFNAYELLRDLCVSCILKIKQHVNWNMYLIMDHTFMLQAIYQTPVSEQADSTEKDDYREAIEYLIETRAFTCHFEPPAVVIGRELPMSDLIQVLKEMAHSHFFLGNFDVEKALKDIQLANQ